MISAHVHCTTFQVVFIKFELNISTHVGTYPSVITHSVHNYCFVQLCTFQGLKKYPFEKVIYCNVGDAHASGQQPLTFVRQLLAACTNPSHMNIYPMDVVERAKLILEHCSGNSVGEFAISTRRECM